MWPLWTLADTDDFADLLARGEFVSTEERAEARGYFLRWTTGFARVAVLARSSTGGIAARPVPVDLPSAQLTGIFPGKDLTRSAPGDQSP